MVAKWAGTKHVSISQLTTFLGDFVAWWNGMNRRTRTTALRIPITIVIIQKVFFNLCSIARDIHFGYGSMHRLTITFISYINWKWLVTLINQQVQRFLVVINIKGGNIWKHLKPKHKGFYLKNWITKCHWCTVIKSNTCTQNENKERIIFSYNSLAQ